MQAKGDDSTRTRAQAKVNFMKKLKSFDDTTYTYLPVVDMVIGVQSKSVNNKISRADQSIKCVWDSPDPQPAEIVKIFYDSDDSISLLDRVDLEKSHQQLPQPCAAKCPIQEETGVKVNYTSSKIDFTKVN